MKLSLIEMIQNLIHVFSSGMNNWGGLHPLIVHFPIVLLFIAPIFILVGLARKESLKSLLTIACVIMILGTFSIFLAVHTGETAAEHLAANPDYVPTLDKHYHLGEQARLFFSILTGLLIAYLIFYQKLVSKFSQRTHTIIISIYLILYAISLLVLFNAAHYGGKLVHKYGIKSTIYSNSE